MKNRNIKNKNSRNNESTHIYALGGLDEVGKNCYCFETTTEMIVVDAGQKFTERSNFSADAQIPNYKFLKKQEGKIAGLFITHGHEDHIGAIPFLLQHVDIKKIYVTEISKALIINKLKYSKISYNPNIFHLLKVGKKIRTRDFILTPFSVNHSIPEALGFHIQSPGGSIVITGDFKFDQMLPTQKVSYDLLVKWGSKGVDLLMSDSTNSKVDGYSKSETEIGIQIKRLISRSKNRIIISSFSSNMYRVLQIINFAKAYKRKVCIIGKSMENAIDVLEEQKYLKPGNWRIQEKDLDHYKKHETLIICTGSQGEELAALRRIADGRVKSVAIETGDEIIFSSSPIPGNSFFINSLTNKFVKLGGKVIDSSSFESIHASGHGYKLEQQLMLNLLKPKYFFPIHGNTSMLKKHQLNAMETGIKSENIFICSNGEVLQLKNGHVGKIKRIIPSESFFVESKTNKVLDGDLAVDSSKMGHDGAVLVYCFLDPNKKNVIDISIRYFGCNNVGSSASKKKLKDTLVKNIQTNELWNSNLETINNTIRDVIASMLFRLQKISPVIIVDTIIK